MIEGWLIQMADAFWARVGPPSPPPRDLGRVIGRGLPVAVIALPQLSTAAIEAWFAQIAIPYRFLCHNRDLHGCVVAARGHGFIFVDVNDSACEQRFTVAHEVAHLLLDYLGPRDDALRAFGPAILPVLNGERLPSPSERIDAMLSQVHLGFYTNLMDRSSGSGIVQGRVASVEHRADRLALELLAPVDEVLTRLTSTASEFERAQQLTAILRDEYDLPRSIAQSYASILLRPFNPSSTRHWLGL